MAKAEKLVPMTFRVPESYIERMQDVADRMGLDRAEVARRAVRNGIDIMETGVKAATNPAGRTMLMMASLLESDPEERKEIVRSLRAIAETRKPGKNKAQPKPAG